jgi:hypothetical protein
MRLATYNLNENTFTFVEDETNTSITISLELIEFYKEVPGISIVCGALVATSIPVYKSYQRRDIFWDNL